MVLAALLPSILGLAMPSADFPGAFSSSEPAWDEKAENDYSAFVARLSQGRAQGKCITLAECLADREVNPLLAGMEHAFRFSADCADAVFVMRAYFAYRTGRPFLFRVKGEFSEEWETLSLESFPSFEDFAEIVRARVSTENFRIPLEMENTETYPVRVSRRSVRPGTIFSDSEGHVLVVSEVRPDGVITFFDSQPNGLLGIKRFAGDLFDPGSADRGGGFRAWRPLEKKSASGEWSFAPNASLENLDAEKVQYQDSFSVRGAKVDFWTWVRDQLAISDSRLAPEREFEARLLQLCDDVRERGRSIDLAIEAGLPGRERLPDPPDDPFRTADGEWEEHATPGRDLRLRRSLRAMRRFVFNSHMLVSQGRMRHLVFDGTAEDLAREYRAILTRIAESSHCRFSYRGSRGQENVLTLQDIVRRAYDLSFNPYVCAELRWGANWLDPTRRRESENCTLTPERRERYLQERTLREIFEKKEAASPPGTRGQLESLDFFQAVNSLSKSKPEG